MTTLPHHVPAPLASAAAARTEPNQALDNYVLATRIVHRAETLLAGAEGFPLAVAHIEAAFAGALSVTLDSTWAEVRAAHDHLDAAQVELHSSGHRLR